MLKLRWPHKRTAPVERSNNGSALALVDACKSMGLPNIPQGVRTECQSNIEKRILRELDDAANVISQNAAGIISEAALLLQLGIVDPVYAEASTTANKVLYLVNMYRGQDLQGGSYVMSLEQKCSLISEAQAQVIACSNRIAEAKRSNTVNIEKALEKQRSINRAAQQLLLGSKPHIRPRSAT